MVIKINTAKGVIGANCYMIPTKHDRLAPRAEGRILNGLETVCLSRQTSRKGSQDVLGSVADPEDFTETVSVQIIAGFDGDPGAFRVASRLFLI